MSTSRSNARPGGVTLVAVLAWISGLLGIVGGVLLILARNNADVLESLKGSSGVVVGAGVVSIVIGLITILVANGLLRGSGFARGLVTLLMVLQIIGGVYALLRLPTPDASAWLNIVIAVVVLLLLFSPRANAFFRG